MFVFSCYLQSGRKETEYLTGKNRKASLKCGAFLFAIILDKFYFLWYTINIMFYAHFEQLAPSGAGVFNAVLRSRLSCRIAALSGRFCFFLFLRVFLQSIYISRKLQNDFADSTDAVRLEQAYLSSA